MNRIKKSVEIWNIDLPACMHLEAECRTLLDLRENGRAAKFIRPEDGAGFAVGRGLLRRILAHYLDCDPAALQFSRNAQGKPFLKEGGPDFNISHSRDRLLVAVTAGRPVGIDIEYKRPQKNMHAIVRRWFSPEEQAWFESQGCRDELFFEIWAKKEAFVKARGGSIYQGLNRFAVPLGEAQCTPVADAAGEWFFQLLPADPAYAAALVAGGPAVPVTMCGIGEFAAAPL